MKQEEKFHLSKSAMDKIAEAAQAQRERLRVKREERAKVSQPRPNERVGRD